MCFLQAMSVMAFTSMHFVHIGDKSATQNQFEGMSFLLLLFCFIFKSFKKHVIVLKVSLNDPDWPHFSAWPTMATLKLPFLLLYFARLVRTSHIFSQTNQCPSEKYFSILIKTTETFTSARGFYQV